ncbi:MAG: PAS domain S-box protein, partial [Planctomycetota bacterium]|nr:PAS domain S-box protein [Planctomycetota bacterium]
MNAVVLQSKPRDGNRFRRPLTRSGFRVVVVSSREEVLAACKDRELGVAVLPWRPGAGGTARVVGEIRGHDTSRGRHTLVVALLTKADARAEARALQGGADVCVSATASAPLFAARLKAGLRLLRSQAAAPRVSSAETKFRAVFESSRDAIMLLDAKGFFDCNGATLEMFGIPTREEFIGLHPAELSPPTQPDGADSRSAAGARIAEAFKQGHKKFQWMHRRRKGEDFPAEVWLTAFHLEGRQALQATVRDVTERKRAEEAVRQGEERYRSLVDNLNVGVYRNTTGKHGRLIEVNPALVQMFGYSTKEEFMQIRVSDTYQDPEDRQVFMQEVLSRGFSEGRELRLRRKDGTPFWGAVTARAVYDKQGNIKWIDGVMQDITERKVAQERLAFNNAMLSAQQATSPDGILVVDVQGRITSYNQRFVDIWGIPPDVVALRSDERALQSVVAKLVDPEGFMARVKYLYEHKEERSHDEITLVDGRTLDRYSGPMFGADGTCYGRVWYFRDITERKRAEQAVREGEERYRSLVDNVNIGIYRNTAGPQGRFLQANPAMVQMFGYEAKEEFLRIKVSDLYEDPAERQVFVKEVLAQGYVQNRELRLRRKNGTPFWGAVTARVAWDHQGQVKWLDGVIEDITERKLAEERLRASERKFRAIIEQAFQFIGLMTTDGILVDVNETALAFSGVSKADVLNKPFWEGPWWKHSEELRATLRAAVKRAAAGEFIRFEATHPAKDGSLHYVDFSLKPIRDDAGNVVLLLPEGRDITERKQAEEASRQSEQRMRLHVQHTPLAVVEWDREFRVVRWNPAAERIFGYTAAEAMGRHGSFILPDSAKPLVNEVWSKLLAGSGGDRASNENITKDGRTILCEWYNTPLVDAKGNAVVVASLAQDVTERKLAEEKLRASEENFRRLVENLSKEYYFYRHDAKGVFTYVSPSVTPMLGYAAEEFLTDYRKYMTDNPINATVHRRSVLTRKGARRPPYEIEVFHKNGSRRTLEVTEVPVVDAAGNVVAVEGLAHDLTARKRAEEALKKERDFSETLVQACPAYFVAIGADGKIMMMNESMLNALGYRKEEVLGKEYLSTFVPEEDRAEVSRVFRTLGSSPESTASTNRVLTAAGAKLLVEWHGRTIFKENGEADYFFGIGNDITERQRLDGELRQSERKYRELVESVNSIVLRMDSRGYITYINEFGERFFGYDRSELIGRDIVGAITPAVESTGRDLRALLQEIARNPEAYAATENENIRRNGERVWIGWTNRVVRDAQGRFVEVLCVGTDITERRRADEALRHAKQLAEDAARAKSEFVANMSHEIRTPMNGVMGMIGLALDTPLNNEQREYLQLAKSSADSLLSIIDDILDFSKIEAKKLELEQIEFSIAEVCDEILPFAGIDAHRKGLELICEIDPAIPPGLIGDPLRLKQVITNLLRNAVKFT